MQKTTICIFESQHAIRKCISTLNTGSVIIVDSVKGISGIRLVLNKHVVKVILLEFDNMDQVNACEFLIRNFPDSKLIAVIRDNDPLFIKCLIGLGVHGILPGNALPEDFIQAIDAVSNGAAFCHSTVSGSLLAFPLDIAPECNYHNTHLTGIEEKVLLLTCQELTIKEISQRLSLSEHTVRNHRVRLMQRLGAKSVIGLVNFAYRRRVLAQSVSPIPTSN